MFEHLASECDQYTNRASVVTAGQSAHINLENLSENRNQTGGLHGTQKLAIGECYALV